MASNPAVKYGIIGTIALSTGVIGGATVMGILMYYVCRKSTKQATCPKGQTCDRSDLRSIAVKAQADLASCNNKLRAALKGVGTTTVVAGKRPVYKDPQTGLEIEYGEAKKKPSQYLFDKEGLTAVEY